MVRLPRSEAQPAPGELETEVESVAARAPRSRTRPEAEAEIDNPQSFENESDEASSPAVPVMTGTHFHSLDEKGRIIVPAKLRPSLTTQFWMMLDENDNIGIYNYQTGLDILSYFEGMMAERPDDEEIAMAVQRTTEAMDYVVVEGGWRVPIPEFLRFRAALDKEVVTVGVLNHAVLWDRTKWEAQQSERMESPEVRRVQARMLRAAASGVGLKKQGAPPQAPPREDEDAARITAGDAASSSAASGSAAGGASAEAASAGDGRRSPRVLALSNLGKSR